LFKLKRFNQVVLKQEPRSMSCFQTRRKILDCAEKLFARHGFHGTSLRRITTGAGVNLAAVHYHFGSKDGLIEAVFRRRLEPLNEERLQRLRALRDGGAFDVEQVVRAFLVPTMRFAAQSEAHRDFLALIGRVLMTPDERLRRMFFALVAPLFMLLLDMLCQALPHLGRDQLFWRLIFALGAMGHYLCLAGQRSSMSMMLHFEMPVPPADDSLIDFFVRGIEAP
jgi:AcrR family transcriptional regulator